MLPANRPPDPNRPSDASPEYGPAMMEDLEVLLPQCPATKPPSSSLHILLTKALGDSTTRDANGAVLLDAKFVDLVLDLSANNDRLMQRLETTVDQLNARYDSVVKRLAEVEAFLKADSRPIASAGPKPNTPKSFAAVASTTLSGSIHAPTTRPPTAKTIASLKPKRVIIHSNPANTTLKNVPSCALVQKANDTLLGLEARVDDEIVAIRGASVWGLITARQPPWCTPICTPLADWRAGPHAKADWRAGPHANLQQGRLACRS
ncbi:hypothetical protein PGT21_029676 [Puccinia graminis f. sp. tritici]|uniref:Uncharacterized protein n=1 Tax=Puccinia graminis f. sp. tritici TaxID=56615 RepID=A0A5B0MI62_PUCGR|nr:hypothetical protein PGTUg99_027337 [Puccinia graminis f. sp. tritici]KAA1091261.1 hypothetical protein PGT21_029676 [Puccinia graminis f. sp. tritici]